MRTIMTLASIPLVLMLLPGCMQIAAELAKADKEAGTRQYLEIAAAARACPAVRGDVREALTDGRLTRMEYHGVSVAFGRAAVAQERRMARDLALKEVSLLPSVAPPPACRRTDPRTGRQVMTDEVSRARRMAS